MPAKTATAQTTTTTTKGATMPAKTRPAKVIVPIVELTAEELRHQDYVARGAKAAVTAAESLAAGGTAVCRTCDQTLPIRKFPTTKRNAEGVLGRASACRACRDSAKAEAEVEVEVEVAETVAPKPARKPRAPKVA